MKLCEMCKTQTKNDQSKFCSQTCKTKYFNDKNNSYSIQKDRAINRKLFFIEQKGGSCELCGYKQNISGLVFHHINPEEKKFEVDARTLGNKSMESLTKEVSKCQLLCQLCHVHHHNPQLDMSNFTDHIINMELKNSAVQKLQNLNKEQVDKIIESINNTNLNKTALWLGISSAALTSFLTRENLKNRIGFIQHTKIIWPSDEELLILLKNSNYSALGRKLGVSDVSIRRRVKKIKTI